MFCRSLCVLGLIRREFRFQRISFGLPPSRKRTDALRQRCEPNSAALCLRSVFDVRVPMQKGPPKADLTHETKREFRLWRIYPGPAPDKRACRSSDGICEPNSAALCLRSVFDVRVPMQKGPPKADLCIGTRNGNRTHNYPLGGGYYIHLTMQAYSFCTKKQAGKYNYLIIAFFLLKNKPFYFKMRYFVRVDITKSEARYLCKLTKFQNIQKKG